MLYYDADNLNAANKGLITNTSTINQDKTAQQSYDERSEKGNTSIDEEKSTETTEIVSTKELEEDTVLSQTSRGTSKIKNIGAMQRSRSTSIKIMRLRDHLPDIPIDQKDGSGVFLNFLERAHNIIEQDKAIEQYKRKKPDSSPDGPSQEQKQHKSD